MRQGFIVRARISISMNNNATRMKVELLGRGSCSVPGCPFACSSVIPCSSTSKPAANAAAADADPLAVAPVARSSPSRDSSRCSRSCCSRVALSPLLLSVHLLLCLRCIAILLLAVQCCMRRIRSSERKSERSHGNGWLARVISEIEGRPSQ